MAEKDGIDNTDSEKSEPSFLEELDLGDQIEIIPSEEETVKPLIPLQEEVVSGDAETGSDALDSDIFTEVTLPSDSEDEKTENGESGDGESKDRSSEDAESELPLIDIDVDIDAENSPQTADEQNDGQSDQGNVDAADLIILEDEVIIDQTPEEQNPRPENEAVGIQETGESEIKSQEDMEPAERQEESNDENGKSAKVAKFSKAKIISGLTVLLIIITAGVIYMTPGLLRSKKDPKPVSQKNPVTRKKIEPAPTVATASKPVESAKPLSKSDIYLAKIKDAGRLRDELLVKKEEILQLKRHYQSGITDLAAQINHESPKAETMSFTEALKNRRIELNLRTIQRRRSYIQRLEAPIRWIEQGSEDILYLIRKAEFDLQLMDIAGGIDMGRHMQDIDAAIHKYRLSAENLTIGPENEDLPTLETIWDQVKHQTKTSGYALQNVTDNEITRKICAGNYENTAELTSISAATARCLSQKTGSDLFLNRLTSLSPSAAEYLSKWHGRWLCINGIKELSPEAAQYLFKWKGNWISLNGLTKFPPELATHLMEWEGNQLELMGLRYDKKNADQKALKYLALWEAMGGKLFVADEVRKKIKRVMM